MNKRKPYSRHVKAGLAFRDGQDFVLLHDPKGFRGAKAKLYDNFKYFDIFEKVVTSRPYSLPLDSLTKHRHEKPCTLPKANGRPGLCGAATTDGHYSRHFLTHLPEEIGYFWCCPACGEPFNRRDSLLRHCQVTCWCVGTVSSERLFDDALLNHFLR